MWASTSSESRWPSGERNATAIRSRPVAKQIVRQVADPTEPAVVEQGLKQGAGQPEHDQQRPDVPHEEVLAHVGEHQLGIQVAERGEEGDSDQQQAGCEAESPPGRDRPALLRQGQRPERVGRRDESERCDLEWLEDRTADVGEGEHGPHRRPA